MLIIFLWLSSVEICNTSFRFVSFIYYLVNFFLPCVYCIVVSIVVSINKKNKIKKKKVVLFRLLLVKLSRSVGGSFVGSVYIVNKSFVRCR